MDTLKAHRDEGTGRWTLEGVESSEKTFETICRKLYHGENFKFARYGDGEFLCMSGKAGHNCDQHEYFPDLGTALNNAFYSDPDYMVGIQPLSVSGGLYQRAVMDRPGPKNIYDADVLHSASIDGKITMFCDAMWNRDVILVGPGHLIELTIGQEWNFITIPDLNCWKNHNDTINKINDLFKRNVVILLCASMTSEVLIDFFRDYDCTMIDCGSVFDPYVGKLSRSYHHKLKLNAS